MMIFIEDCFLNNILFWCLPIITTTILLNINISKIKSIFLILFVSCLNMFVSFFDIYFACKIVVLILIFSIFSICVIKNLNIKKLTLCFFAMSCFSVLYYSICILISKMFKLRFSLFFISSTKTILISYLLFFIFIKIIQGIKNQFKISRFLYDIKIIKNNKKIKIKAFLDTGNMLVDNVSNKPVLIVNYSVLSSLLPDFDIGHLLSRNCENGYYIKYNTVSGCGEMFVFCPDKAILIDGKKEKEIDVVLGLSLKGFGNNSEFSALLNPLAMKL